jgi:hypothetical protein
LINNFIKRAITGVLFVAILVGCILYDAFSFGFLEKGKTYKAIIYADGEKADWKTNPTEYQITEQEVTADDTLNIRMAAGGGQAISFMPLQK